MAGIILGARTAPGQQGSDTLANTSPALLSVSVDLTAGRPVIALAGELDVATAPAVKAIFFETFDGQRRRHVVVDGARLSFCDCAGLSVFLHAHNWALSAGGWVRLCRTSPHLHKVLGITGLVSMLQCYPTAADAFADVERSASHQREQERT